MAKGKYEKWMTKEGLCKIEGWARDGLINAQISKNMGISRETLNQWAKKFPNISDALKRGKDIVDREVENALHKRAVGYTYDEVTYIEGEETKRVRKRVAPETVAIIYWLNNRKPEEWRNKRTVEGGKEELEKLDAILKGFENAANK